MTEKDIWKWLLSNFTNDLLYDIYDKQKVVCNGFRANSIKGKNSNRKLFISNLLSNDNFKKLVKWSREKMPESLLTEEEFHTFELEELIEAASKHSAMVVLLKLLNEDYVKKAVQLFSYLRDKEIAILEETIIEESVVNEAQETERESKLQGGKQKNIERIEKKLDQKITKLQVELTKRDTQHKSKVEKMEKNYQDLQKKFNEKSQEFVELNRQYEKLKKHYEEERETWEQKHKQFKEIIQNLELQFEAEKEMRQVDQVEDIPVEILVIGKPMFTNQFKSQKINFTFLEGNNILQYDFSKSYDAYWVLLYELPVKQLIWFNANKTRLNIDVNKVTFCKDFAEVKTHMQSYIQHEERV